MSATGEGIFEDVVETRPDICRRCFKTAESTETMNSTGSEGPACGEDCGTLSASLESDSISRGKLEGRAPRLLMLVEDTGYDIDGEIFTEAVDRLADASISPRDVFVDAIRAGICEASIEELLDKHDIESEETQRTRMVLRELPTTDLSDEDLEAIDDRVASEITTVSERFIGARVYYLPDADAIPSLYHPVRAGNDDPKRVMNVVVRRYESSFWERSVGSVVDWLEELDDALQEHAAPCLFERIRSRQRTSFESDLSPKEQFRRTGLWPAFDDEKQEIMGFLRRQDGPQSVADIADHVGLSEQTTWTLLMVLRDTSVAERDADIALWRAE